MADFWDWLWDNAGSIAGIATAPLTGGLSIPAGAMLDKGKNQLIHGSKKRKSAMPALDGILGMAQQGMGLAQGAGMFGTQSASTPPADSVGASAFERFDAQGMGTPAKLPSLIQTQQFGGSERLRKGLEGFRF